jgi:hypothetical protein
MKCRNNLLDFKFEVLMEVNIRTVFWLQHCSPVGGTVFWWSALPTSCRIKVELETVCASEALLVTYKAYMAVEARRPESEICLISKL